MTAFKNTNTTTILAAALACAAGAAWMLTDYVNGNLVNLTVERVPTKTVAAVPFDVKGWLKTIAPVWVPGARQSGQAEETASVDGLFKAEREVEIVAASLPIVPQEPDYASLLPSRMQLDGLSAGGAFINGKFYRVGEPITDFEYPSAGRQVIPVIVEVKTQSVVVKHGSRLTELKA